LLRFKQYLRKGDFRVPFCTLCRERVWPPFELCPNCFSKTSLKRISRTGILVEFSSDFLSADNQGFGIVDFKGIFLLGSLQGNDFFPGCKVIMYDCGIDDHDRSFYKFKRC
jgi:uncharacterized protein